MVKTTLDNNCVETSSVPSPNFCPQLPGTILRISIPPGAVINLLNIIELSSPGGICVVLRLPILGGFGGLSTIIESIKEAGGSVEFVNE
jgi:hypothetical protein